jgi:hypothetical protein
MLMINYREELITMRTKILAGAVLTAALAGCGGTAAALPVAAPKPAVTITVPAAPAKTVTTTPAAPAPARTVYVPVQAAAPAGPVNCTGGAYSYNSVYAGPGTSCPFALAVVAAYQGPGVQDVYSPVTGQVYAMTYQVTGAGTVIATGGNGAYVQF